jgi:serine protease
MNYKITTLLMFTSFSSVAAGVIPAKDYDVVDESYIVVLDNQQPAMTNNIKPLNTEDIALSLIREAKRTNSREKYYINDTSEELARDSLTSVYEKLFSGFAAKLTAEEAQRLSNLAGVQAVYPDIYVYADEDIPTGLDRVDQRKLPLDGTYNSDYSGRGVSIYVIDSGIDFSHPEFSGRAYSGYDFVDGDSDASDCQGHGTHVAATAAGKSVGIAPEADIYSLRILDCDARGKSSASLNAFEWVAKNAHKPAVVNYSVGRDSRYEPIDSAVQNLVTEHNIQFANSAGNGDDDACGYTPVAPAAITVGASNSNDDYRRYNSNFGKCVDIFAPGTNIKSAMIGGGYVEKSGTSMATPHVAGAAALYLESNPDASASDVKQALLNASTQNELTDIGSGSPNLLLYTNFDADGQSGTPTAVATASASVIIGSGMLSLTGKDSLDPDGDALSYHWQQVSPVSPLAIIENADSANTMVHFGSTTEVVDYTFSLLVSDGKLSDIAEVAITQLPEQSDNSCPSWKATTTYIGGEVVSWEGQLWLAQWWTVGEEPGTTGEWGVWRIAETPEC